MSAQSASIPADSVVNNPISDDGQSDVSRLQKLVAQASPGHPDLPKLHQMLGEALTQSYKITGNLNDLGAALQNFQIAVDLIPESSPGRVGCLHGLAASYQDRYQRLGDLQDLETALQKFQEVVHLTPEGHPDRAGYLENLGTAFRARYQRLGDMGDLTAALENFQNAVNLTPEGHTDRAKCLQGLAASYQDRYQRLGKLEDLDSSVQKLQEVVNLTPEGHPDKAGYLENLGTALRARYQRLGDMADLAAALQNCQSTVNLTPEGHTDRTKYLQSLATCFQDQYARLGDLKDLDAALQISQEAVDLIPEGHPDRAGHLNNLALFFRVRYERSGDLKDLEAALQNHWEAVNLIPEGHPNRAGYLQSLVVSLQNRYKRLGDMEDLDAALQMEKEAVNLTPEGHPDKAEHLKNLAAIFSDRYKRLNHLQDLEASLQNSQDALDLIPEGHPSRAGHLQSLAMSYADRYAGLQQPVDLEAVHTHFHASFQTHTSNPESSWNAAQNWASFSTEHLPSECITAYSTAFNMLPEILWLGNSIPVRHAAIWRLRIEEQTSTATRACIELSNITAAVEIMEQGLAIIFQQMLQLKPDVNGLPPSQAAIFQFLSSELYRGISDPRDLAIQRQVQLNEIRQQPDFKYFLLPKAYNSLSSASQGGPVVILNSHKDGCDSIIILDTTSDPVHVPLPNVTVDLLKSQKVILDQLLHHLKVRNQGEMEPSSIIPELFTSKTPKDYFEDILTGLWTCIVSPIYQVLNLHNIHNGRLWWLPTGAFVGLPLHASPPTNEFIHSYTTSLGALLDANAKIPASTVSKFGLVGVTDTTSTGMNINLKGVGEEVSRISTILVPKSVHVDLIDGVHATVDAVKLKLQKCPWVHLASHGEQNLADSTKSHLQLYDGALELDTILRMNLSDAQFIFLSAGETARGDPNLVNESFHLTGGCIAAGFRGAVGTLWSINGEDRPLVAEIFYSHLFRKGEQPQASDAAEALHFTIKELKDRKVPYEHWIPFIHMGI